MKPRATHFSVFGGAILARNDLKLIQNMFGFVFDLAVVLKVC